MVTEAEQIAAYHAEVRRLALKRLRWSPPRFAVYAVPADQHAAILIEHGEDDDAIAEAESEILEEPLRTYRDVGRALAAAERLGGFVKQRVGLRWVPDADGWGEWTWSEELLIDRETGRPFRIGSE